LGVHVIGQFPKDFDVYQLIAPIGAALNSAIKAVWAAVREGEAI
jgi:hypothetical protein